MCIWDVATCERIKRVKAHTDFVNTVAVSRHTSHAIVSGSDDCSVRMWDRRKRMSASNTSGAVSFDCSPFQVLAVCYGANETEIVSGGIDNELKVWDVRKPGTECLYRMAGHLDSVTGLALSPDATHVASNSMDNCVRIWDVRAFVQNPQQRCVGLLGGHTHNFEKVTHFYLFYFNLI